MSVFLQAVALLIILCHVNKLKLDNTSPNRKSIWSEITTDPCELGAHQFSISNAASSKHVLSALGVDVTIGHVQRLRLVQPTNSLVYITRMLQ